jgi:hypothetical protein
LPPICAAQRTAAHADCAAVFSASSGAHDMDPQAHLFRVSADVTDTIKGAGIPFQGFTQKFSDLQIQPNAFPQLLDEIQATINGDQELPKLWPFKWNSIKGFAAYYYPRTVTELIWAIDGIISHSPFTS